MPELPDLVYIVKSLSPRILGRAIVEVMVKEPIVIRMLRPGAFADSLRGRKLSKLTRHGPFLRFELEDAKAGPVDLVIHNMLTGQLQLAPAGSKKLAHLCFALTLDDGNRLSYGDDKRMGKVYVADHGGSQEAIPGYDSQGIDVTSEAFTFEAFERLIKGKRQQARVFVMDQTSLSAIGNAYADEILFAAGIHPKTSCSSLSAEERGGLYEAIRSVMAWGIAEVEKAAQPTEVKVREHMRVRGRKDEPCPKCGAKIRREGVLGYDAFFCPQCQPPRSKRASPLWR